MGIRTEKKTNIEKIWQINVKAFETELEANLVNTIRSSGISNISLVYEENNELVGHIFLTPVKLIGDTSGLRLMGLGPIAVKPKDQNKGIGSSLVKAGIQQCLNKGYDAIVVLGHPNYYPKFGFVPSVRYGIKSEYEVPEEVFMVLGLKENALKGKKGIVKYHKAFDCDGK